MYIPNYSITNLTLKYTVNIYVALEKLNSTPISYKQKSLISKQLLAEDMYILSQLCGMKVDFNTCHKIANGQIIVRPKTPESLLNNWRNVWEFVKTYNKELFMSPSENLLLHLNQLIGKNTLDSWDYGRFRQTNEQPLPIYDTWSKFEQSSGTNIHYTTIFKEIFDWMNYPKNPTDPLIRTAIFTYEFIVLYPFISLNQISLFAFVLLLFKYYHLLKISYLPFISVFELIDADLGMAMNIVHEKGEITPFVELFLYALNMTLRDMQHSVYQEAQKLGKFSSKIKTDINARQFKALEYLNKFGKITRSEYTKIMGTSFMTSYRDLQDMVKKGLIIKKGVQKSTYYTLAKEIKQLLPAESQDEFNRKDIPRISDFT